MSKRPELPIGIQDFAEMRNGGYLYVDKTQAIYRLLTASKYYRLYSFLLISWIIKARDWKQPCKRGCNTMPSIIRWSLSVTP
jgi:Predicted AAA-ATPase.